MYHFFISDKENKERRENVKSQCARIGIEPIFFDAIMGKNYTKEELRDFVSEEGVLSPGEIGCALSHLAVFKAFLHSDEPVMLVFEDDVAFSDVVTVDLLKQVAKFVAKQKEGAVMSLYKSIFNTDKVADMGSVNIYNSLHFYCTHAYVINRQAAENILAIQNPLSFPIDYFKMYYWLGACRLYSLGEDIVVQNEAVYESTIGDGVRGDAKLKARLRGKAQRRLFMELPIDKKIGYIKKRIEKCFY